MKERLQSPTSCCARAPFIMEPGIIACETPNICAFGTPAFRFDDGGAQLADLENASAGVPGNRMKTFHQQTPRIQPSRRALPDSVRLSGGFK